MLTEAGRQAEAHKQELFSQARQEVEQIRQKWAASLEREKENFLQNLKQRLAQEVVAISRRALKELGRPGVGAAVDRGLSGSPPAFAPGGTGGHSESVKETGGELLITTAFELSEETRQKIAAQVQEQFGRGLALRFATSGELLAGIELLTSSRKLAWSLGSFLDSLEEDLSQAFQELDKERGGMNQERPELRNPFG